ncbi:MAG TPA: sigma-70 family RNA polymerase sigma factor, partial [Terriglobales bacterium]|nr:sigma-70 family RNA polymerase sigma factor [Terriglobales bacterium]
ATQHGDLSAFEQLVGRYDAKLFRIAQNVTHNQEDSEDAVQEAFLKAFEHLDSFREDAQFSTWLIRITLNQALSKLRKQRIAKEVSLNEDFEEDDVTLPREVADWAPNPEELYQVSELRSILIASLKQIRPILRAVFVLRDIEGLSIDETAGVLQLSVGTVKARLWRARQQLRKLLTKYFNKQKAYPMAAVAPGTAHLNLAVEGSSSDENQLSLRTQARDLIRAAQFAVQGLESVDRSGEDRTRAVSAHPD